VTSLLVMALVGTGCGGGGSSSSTSATRTGAPPRTATARAGPGPAKTTPAGAKGARHPRAPIARGFSPHPVVVARGIPSPTNVTFDPRGRMFVTSGAGGPRSTDGVWYVPAGGTPRHVAAGLPTALGLRWADGSLYVGHIVTPSTGRVTRLSGFTGTAFRRRSIALDGLTIGRHQVDSIVQGPDGRLFVGVGSTGDNDGHPGQIVSFAPGGGARRVEATGLRNPYGLAFHGRRLFVTDNARDDLGPFRPPEEIDAFDPSGPAPDFGFPGCYDQGGPRCAGTTKPVAELAPHASSDGLAIQGTTAYVAEVGSSFSANPTGSDVQRVDLRTGHTSRLWRSPVAHDPLGAAIGPSGDLYVTLFVSGRVVRFARR
jgi:glucose/arabinose dehydrogenase